MFKEINLFYTNLSQIHDSPDLGLTFVTFLVTSVLAAGRQTTFRFN